MWESLPVFGKYILIAILVASSYTFAVSVAAGAGRPRFLQAARTGAYGSVALVGVAVLVLAYAFVSHDFRLDYVERYSDRTMTTPWLIAALWGGQDGSLLWWLFLTSFFSAACVWWLKGRYRELQPWVIATLMSVMIFLTALMVFDTNPFRLRPSGAAMDGQGLNYQLRNFYMIIHPPSLYIGFTSAAVPFAFSVAALVTGRLNNEWIIATRKWMIFSWLFLSIGNALGMLWAHEELGWGGYWAWDPVENAAFLPWLTASAYVHSVMIQERRNMLKMWNVILICLTFFLTYFGTFLTRSGLIASVHSFAKSGIGDWFLGYMIVIVTVSVGLIAWRSKKLRSTGQLDSVLSREFAFVVNNWVLLLMTAFIVGATLWPRISEAVWDQKSTLGAPFYNQFMPALGLLLIFLMGTAPLLGWRKTSPALFRKSFIVPVCVAGAVAIAHLALGSSLGYPAIIDTEPLYGGVAGEVLAGLKNVLPVVTTTLVAYNIAVVTQEFQRGVAARRKKKDESIGLALGRLLSKSRRRYGGYIVHVGIAVMFLGFAGKAWEIEKEVALAPGESFQIGDYNVTYEGKGSTVDHEKRIAFATLSVMRNGEPVGTLKPARFIYKASPGQPSTEIARLTGFKEELYVSPGMINANTGVASFKFYINPLILLVMIGVLISCTGALIALVPELSTEEASAFGYLKALGATASMVMLSVMLALSPSLAYAQQEQHEMDRVGVVEQTPKERALFKQLLCDCGSCPHEPLETCTCGWAHKARQAARVDLERGVAIEQIVADYAALHGSDAVILQATRGKNIAVWAVPAMLGLAGVGLMAHLGRRWSRAGDEEGDESSPLEKEDQLAADADEDYESRLDAELRNLEE